MNALGHSPPTMGWKRVKESRNQRYECHLDISLDKSLAFL